MFKHTTSLRRRVLLFGVILLAFALLVIAPRTEDSGFQGRYGASQPARKHFGTPCWDLPAPRNCRWDLE